jgi:hypothetical protein
MASRNGSKRTTKTPMAFKDYVSTDKEEEAKERRMDIEHKRKAALDQAKDNARYFDDPPSLPDDPEEESPASPVEESPPSKKREATATIGKAQMKKSNAWSVRY